MEEEIFMAYYTISLKLKTNKQDARFLDQVFYHANHLHNQAVSYCQKQLYKLKHDLQYKRAKRKYGSFKQDGQKVPKEITKILKDKVKYYGLTKAELEPFVKNGRYKCSTYVGAAVAQSIVNEVLQSLEKVLYGNGKKMHYRSLMDMNSIEGKSTDSNITVKGDKVSVGQGSRKRPIGIQFPKKKTKEREYFEQAYRPDDIAYYRIKRRMFRGGWHYYLEMVIKGIPPKKHEIAESGRAGIDNGTSTVAIVTEDMVLLENLDMGVKSVAEEIKDLQKRMDQSKRMTNPKNYKEDGTVKKGRKKWSYSKHYRWLHRCLKALYRKRAEGLKQHHEILANLVLEHACQVYTEKSDTNALKKRSKKTKKRQDGKYTKKKRFGKSINTYAPALFIKFLNRKLGYVGSSVQEVNTKTFKASQYDHLKQTCQKKQLSDRSFLLGDQIHVQRDLYSAFLLMNSKDDLQKPDQNLCEATFQQFLEMHDKEIQHMLEHTDIYSNPCFGLKDFQ